MKDLILKEECLEMELHERRVPFTAKPKLPLSYKGRPLKSSYEPDLLCYGKLVVELKAVSALCDEHRAQVLNYLHAGPFPLGLLVNFGHHPKVEYERLALTSLRSLPPEL
ncbi:MAG: GxxExxY protein [Candidatus Methylacidiphilales bacterium]|nr:GxxExxY protein [Candidatus Methylacidiphilales bacterium]